MQVQGESLAATKVQSMYRGRLARKKTAPRLQKNFSSISEEDVAATKLQSLFRGSQYRKNMRHSEPSLVQKGRSSLRLVVQSNDPTSNSNAALMNAKQSAETLKNHILSDIAFISDQADTDQMLGEDEEARNFTERCNRKWKAYQQLLWYWIDQRISGFWAAKYILLLFFIVFVSLFSAALLAIALKLDTLFGNNDNEETEFADFGELWWQAWGYTVDGPWHIEYLANNYVEWSRPKVWCFFTVASGCSAFMGILVMSSFLGVMVDLVERAPRGSSSVMEKGHHIILNWSGEIHFLVEQLGYAMESQKGGTIVLLNTRAKTEQVKDLRTVAKGLKRRGINLLVRQGNPRLLDDLRRVGVSSAKSVIMLSPNIADALDADVECSNVLLQISSFVDHTQVPIILELRDEESRLLVESAARGRCNPVAAHDMAARILAKAAHTRRLADVYESMLGFEEDEFYFVNMAEMPQLLGKRFGEIIYSLPSAIPIGFSKGGTVTLNPPENAIFAPGSELIVYAEDDSKIVFKPPHESNMPSTDGMSPLNTPGILGNGMINNRRVSGLGANNISAGRKRRSGLPGLGVSLPGNAPGMPGPVAAQSERQRTILGDTLVGLEANLQTSPSKKNEPSAFGEDHRLPEAVLVCNWCKNMEEIIVTIDASLKYGSTIILLSQKSLEDRASAFRENGFDPNIDLMNIKIKHYIGEGSLKADLLQLSQPSVVEMNHILVVADECHGNDRMRSDAQNLCILFNVKQVTEEERQSVWMLQQSGIDLTALKKRGRNNPTAVSWEGLKSRFTASKLLNLMAPSPEPSRKNVHIVVEILDSKTRAVVQDDPRLSESCDWITTPNLVAETLSMVAERPETVWILKALLTHESGQHIFVRPASRYVKGGEIVNFWTIMKRAYKERHIALGYTNGAHGPVIMNPKDKDKTRAWNILDNVVTIGYDDSHDRRLAALKAIHTTATVTSASNKFNAVVETNTMIGKLPASRVDSRNINPKQQIADDSRECIEDTEQSNLASFQMEESYQSDELEKMRVKVLTLERERDASQNEMKMLRKELRVARRALPRKIASAPSSTRKISETKKVGAKSPSSLLEARGAQKPSYNQDEEKGSRRRNYYYADL